VIDIAEYIDNASYPTALLFLDRAYYETLSSYSSTDDRFLHVVSEDAPDFWTAVPLGPWIHVIPPIHNTPFQGWKIHVSSVPKNAEDTLRIVSKIAYNASISFKCVRDHRIFNLINSKQWPRESSGKFITLYPPSNILSLVLNELYTTLKGFEGPYILSDQRYLDSKVLYYRFGAIVPNPQVNLEGVEEQVLISPDGQSYVDRRMPYFLPPPWVSDPFDEEITDSTMEEPQDASLGNGRFTDIVPVTFSNNGGVYRAHDLESGNQVIIKEARPWTSVNSQGTDSVRRLYKEWDLLTAFCDHGLPVPRPITIFQEWEHHYLVEDYVDGESLATYPAKFNPLFTLSNPSLNDVQQYCTNIEMIIGQVVEVLFNIWNVANVISIDLSPSNFLFRGQNHQLTVLDLEGFSSVNEDVEVIATPGFTQPGFFDGSLSRVSFRAQRYSLAYLIGWLCGAFPQQFYIDESMARRYIRWMSETVPPLRHLLHYSETLMSGCDDPLSTEEFESFLHPRPHIPTQIPHDTAINIRPAIRFITKGAMPHRSDRLFASDPDLTNPLNISFGALGVLHVWQYIGEPIPELWTQWVLQQYQKISQRSYPPGLYVGLSGIAWTLLELGHDSEAVSALRMADTHPLLFKGSDLFYGISGYGLTCLKFWLHYREVKYLDQARLAARWLHRQAMYDVNGNAFWAEGEDPVWVGYARGSSGVAMFLLYLWLATQDAAYLQLGQKALLFDLTQGIPNAQGHLGFPEQVINEPRSQGGLRKEEPYWFCGSAGVGTTLVRYAKASPSTVLEEWLSALIPYVCRQNAMNCGVFRGLSGMGHFLLDVSQLLGDDTCSQAAVRIAQALNVRQSDTTTGIGYPGDGLYRYSMDYGTGSAGVMSFLHRLSQGFYNPNFMLDELLP